MEEKKVVCFIEAETDPDNEGHYFYIQIVIHEDGSAYKYEAEMEHWYDDIQNHWIEIDHGHGFKDLGYMTEEQAYQHIDKRMDFINSPHVGPDYQLDIDD